MGTSIYLVICLAAWLSSIVLKRQKNVPARWFRTLLSSLLLPGVGTFINALRRGRPATGRNEQESQVLLHRFTIDGKKNEAEKIQQRIDRLEMYPKRNLFYKLTHPGQAFSTAQINLLNKRLAAKMADIRSDYENLGRAERRLEGSRQDRFVGIRMDINPEGGRRVFLPYDLTPEQKNEIQYLLSNEYGGDLKFLVGDHRSADLKGFNQSTTVLVFDSREKTLSPFGTKLSDENAKLVSGCMVSLRESLIKEGLYETYRRKSALTQNVVTLDPIGEDAVALNMNGVTLAYAVGGPDGKIRVMGHDVKTGDREGLKLASRFNEVLKGETTMEGWIKAAAKIVLSPENIKSGKLALSEKQSERRKLEEKRAMRQRILKAPKQSLKSLKGLKL